MGGGRAARTGGAAPLPQLQVYEREGVFTQDTVEAFDEELDEGAEASAADYRRLLRANLAEEIDRFADALRVDAILPRGLLGRAQRDR